MMKEKKIELWVAGIFGLIGVIFLIVGLVAFFAIFGKFEDKIQVEGTIERISYSGKDTPSVYVSYDVNGEEYISRLPYYTSGMQRGQTVKMHYNKNNPDVIGNQATDIMVLIFPALGLLFIGVGSSFVIVKMRKKKRAKDLIQKRRKNRGKLCRNCI